MLQLPCDARQAGGLRSGARSPPADVRHVPQPTRADPTRGCVEELRVPRLPRRLARRAVPYRQAARPRGATMHAVSRATRCQGGRKRLRGLPRGRQEQERRPREPAPGIRYDASAAASLPEGRTPRARAQGKGRCQPAACGTCAPPPPVPADTFSHDRHKQLACLTCHVTRRPNASLTFLPPRGCQICHHQAPATSDCATCHALGELAPAHAETIAVAVANRPPHTRPVAFSHTTHAELRCTTCHTTVVSLDPAAPVKTCTACHEDHHVARRDCSSCHSGVDMQAAHRDSVDTHVACDACHREATVARLVPDRGLCITCHTAQRDHYATRECTTCHFLATPDDYRAHLRKVGA